jgi:hypothetical protein
VKTSGEVPEQNSSRSIRAHLFAQRTIAAAPNPTETVFTDAQNMLFDSTLGLDHEPA